MIRRRSSLTACFFLVLGCLLAPACAIKKPLMPVDPGPEQMQSVWNLFHAEYMQPCPPRDFFTRASVNYSSGDRNSRLLFSFWGRTNFPVRMDLQAGVGAMVAHWREDEQGWIGYYPGSREAFFSSDSRAGAAMLGLAMPLRLNAFAQILIGCWDGVIPKDYVFAQFVENHFEYLLEHKGKKAVLVLTPEGLPVSLREDDAQGWIIAIDEWLDNDRRSPKRLSLRHEKNFAVVRLQRMDFSTVRWQEADLSLELPFGTTLRHLEPVR